MDLVVSVKENPHRILVLRLGFQEYTWELVGHDSHDQCQIEYR